MIVAVSDVPRSLSKLMANTRDTGVYTRVLPKGLVPAGDGFDLVNAHPKRITIVEVSGIIHEKPHGHRTH